MTNPNFYQQNVYQQNVHRSLTAARQAGEEGRRLAELRRTNQAPYAYRHGAARTGVGLVGRFIGFVISMAFIGLALVIFAMILKQADPHLFNHLVSSIHRLS